MKLTIFNGSPRGKASNTKILMDHFSRGFTEISHSNEAGETIPNKIETAYLVKTDEIDEMVEMFQDAERVILAFPLYTDAMPGIVKNFIEKLAPLCEMKNNPELGFLVQSGFSETIHSRYVEKYLEKLARRLHCKYLGTIIKGGVEGIKIKPPKLTRKLFDAFYRLGLHFGKTGALNEEIIKSLAKNEKMSGAKRALWTILSKIGIADFHWNMQLKKNNAYDKRFAKPYERP
ncbi:MAG: NAD(P)H-dependent oxidoreductase [bacterium]|nr:NAD(P)H-dependent oxidoreductase [bacterium]